MTEKLQLGIYKIKNEIHEPRNVVKVDVKYLCDHFNDKGYKEQLVKPSLSKNFNVFLFFKRKRREIKWKRFVGEISEGNQNILKTKNTNSESYILLLENKATKIIYATTGGFGYTALQGIAESEFGLEILSRLINTNDKKLRATKEKSFTGGILGEVKFFRTNYNLNENESFGNFYQELQSSLDKDLLVSTFGFSKTDIKSDALCIAKNSFTIRKAIDFNQLLSIIEKCDKLLNTSPPLTEINSIIKIDKSNKTLVDSLQNELDSHIWQLYDGTSNDLNIEISHKNFDEYLSAETFFFKNNASHISEEFQEPIKNLSQILTCLNSLKLNNSTLISLVDGAEIESKDSSGKTLTSGKLKGHFHTEIAFKGGAYFLSNNEWFQFKEIFIDKLNTHCEDFITKNCLDNSILPLKKWKKNESENKFNEKHIGKNNFLVFDKVLPRNIEICDIMHWNSDSVYFVHVKSGFNKNMRELTQQILIAARIVEEDLKTGDSTMKKYYNLAKKYSGKDSYRLEVKKQLNGISEKDFIDILHGGKPTFVLAVKHKDKLSNIKKFQSNVAKFHLHELIKSMKRLGVTLKIIQI